MTRPRRAMALVGSALLAGACSGGGHRAAPHPQAPATTSTTVPPPPTTEAAPQYSPSPYAWQRVTSQALALGGGAGSTISALLAPTPASPWLLAGTRFSSAGVPDARLWTSSDGITWSEAGVAAGTGASQARGAAEFRGATVIVGAVGAGANQQAAVWLSPTPGAPFQASEVPRTSGASVMTMVTAGPLGYFGAGTIDGRFGMWSSTDGRTWTELSPAEKVIGASPGARVETLLATSERVYAAGSLEGPTGQEAAIWGTADGLNWTRVQSADPALAGPGAKVIYSLAPLGAGLVAVGAINRGPGWLPAAWISPDGASWSQPSTDFPGLSQPAGAATLGPSGGFAVRSVASVLTPAGTPSLIATGGGPGRQQAWRSSDGLHWTSVGVPDAPSSATGWRATLTAATTNAVVIADGEAGQPHLLVGGSGTWREPSSDPAVFGPVRPRARPLSLQRGGTGLVLAVQTASDPQSIGNTSATISYLTSADGSTWTSFPPPSSMAPGALPAPGAIAVHLGAGWVAAGPSGGGAGTWRGSDGTHWTSSGPLPLPEGALTAVVAGACSATGQVLATVGSAGGAPVTASASNPTGPPQAAVAGRAAAAWTYTAGLGWQRAAVASQASGGPPESMSGCISVPGGLVAYGVSGSDSAATGPALWHSGTGTSWARSAPSGFSSVTAGLPLVAMAAGGSAVLGVASAGADTGPAQVSAEPVIDPPGPAVAAQTDGAVGPAPAVENGRDQLWLSRDGGGTWQEIDITASPWLGTQDTLASVVGFVAGQPVVAGSIDGQLAVWVGTAASPPSSP